MAAVVLVRSSIQSSSRKAGFVAVFAALLALVLVWTGTRGLEPGGGTTSTVARGDTAERATFGSVPDGKPVNSEFSELGSECKGEELDESDPTVAVFVDPEGARVTFRAQVIGEAGETSTIRARRVVACIGARGPPVG